MKQIKESNKMYKVGGVLKQRPSEKEVLLEKAKEYFRALGWDRFSANDYAYTNERISKLLARAIT